MHHAKKKKEKNKITHFFFFRSDGVVLNTGFKTNWFTQTGLLAQRSFRNFYRDKFLQIFKFINTVAFAIMIGLIYLQVDSDQTSITDRVGALFFILTNQAFPAVIDTLNACKKRNIPFFSSFSDRVFFFFFFSSAVADEKVVFLKERSSHMYRVSPYYLTKSISELPGQILFPVISASITYWMIGFQSSFERYCSTFFFVVRLFVVVSSLELVQIHHLCYYLLHDVLCLCFSWNFHLCNYTINCMG